MAKYSLVVENDESFDFDIRGKVFIFKRPTTRETKELVLKFRAVENEKDEEKQKQIAQELDELLHSYIQPFEHDTSIDEALEQESMVTTRAFNKMLRDEVFNFQ